MISINNFCRMDCPPYKLSGTVVGTLLNHAPVLLAMGDAARELPYKAPPQRPVLYVKPRNTFLQHGAVVEMPSGESHLEIGFSIGMVIGQSACHVSKDQAMEHIAGYLAVADICIPHASVYRPSVRQRAQDGFCPLGPVVSPRDEVADPDQLAYSISANGQVVHQGITGDWVRPAAQLLADVSEFMTLSVGDVLLLGTTAGAPRLSAGTQVQVQLGTLAPLTFTMGPHRPEQEGRS
jgi:5-oxopent-3-ene-1,2,5-tricarboxylate decarboxylase/2-hydroxyhepta-2,4-diene-1,7-dioate isomerase